MSRIRLPLLRGPVGAVLAAAVTTGLLLAQAPAAQAASEHAKIRVAGYSGEQLVNARIIVAVAAARGLPPAAAVLGVACAMGESSLRNLPYGDDAINPDGTVADSVGLFQQQHWWGTLTQRMTPAHAAGTFYDHLVRVRDWERRTPTAAIHAVQGNADPGYYTRFVPAAIEVVRHVLEHPAKIPASAQKAPPAGAKHPHRKGTTPAPLPTVEPLPEADYSSIPSADLFDALDRDWAAKVRVADPDAAIAGTFADGLGIAGGTVAGGSDPLP